VIQAALYVVACNGQAEEVGPSTWYRVNAQIETGMDVPLQATLRFDSQRTASEIFRKIGIELTWRPERRWATPKGTNQAVVPDRELAIEVVAHAPSKHPGRALAMAVPYGDSRVRIVVFYDRVNSLLRCHQACPETVLGYVLAHEICHVLQGIARHSETGIMRAVWSSNDFDRMGTGGLTFSTDDIQLMRLAAESRASAVASATLNAKF
jgi:hypothetical protein